MPSRHADQGVKYLEVPTGLGGQRIDNFLARELKGIPRPLIYRVIRRGEVRVNGGRVAPAFRLNDGDRIRVPPLRVNAPAVTANAPQAMIESLKQAVLLETPQLLIVNKPAGMAVHGGSKVKWGVIEALRASRPEKERLDLVHRLDRETSGCLVMAKSMQALRAIQEQLRVGGVEKRYLALLQGAWKFGERRIDTLARDTEIDRRPPGSPARNPPAACSGPLPSSATHRSWKSRSRRAEHTRSGCMQPNSGIPWQVISAMDKRRSTGNSHAWA
jgi:23S rRNA pseudouridine955/2504/2580 synthase